MAGLRSSASDLLFRDNPIDEFESHFLDHDSRFLEPMDDGGESKRLMALSIVQHIAGALSFLGGMHIFCRAWSRRICPFDRIMLGLSVHTMLWGIVHLWGTAAIPYGTPGVYGARGNTTTCSAMGFLFQVSMVVPFYYIFLSCYSWVVVMHGNFDAKKYELIEVLIHIGVHVFPIASAVYLVATESFHSNGLYCWIVPSSGCDGDEECNNPQEQHNHPKTTLWIFGGIPAIFFVAVPTIVMGALTICVYLGKTKQPQSILTAGMVAKQSFVYLGSLYWVCLPLFVFYGVYNSNNYWIGLWVNAITGSMGLWFAIVYWYFSTEDESEIFDCDDCGGVGSETFGRSKLQAIADILDPTEAVDDIPSSSGVESNESRDSSGIENIDCNQKPDEEEIVFSTTSKWWFKKDKKNSTKESETINTQPMISRSSVTTRRPSGSSVGEVARRVTRRASRRRSSKRFSFNIFDGTNGGGMFAAFVFDGDSEDEEADQEQSEMWANCQNMISER